MMLTRLLIKTCILVLGQAYVSSCVSTFQDEVTITRPPEDDKDYYRSLQVSSRQADVIKDFEMRYRLHVTYLSSDFRNALNKRLEAVFLQGGSTFEEASAKIGFFVTIFSPESSTVDLANPNHWTMLLESKDGPIRPVLVKRLNDKLRWRSFFDSVNQWSYEYLVVFDLSPTAQADARFVDKSSITLNFANADAKVSLVW